MLLSSPEVTKVGRTLLNFDTGRMPILKTKELATKSADAVWGQL